MRLLTLFGCAPAGELSCLSRLAWRIHSVAVPVGIRHIIPVTWLVCLLSCGGPSAAEPHGALRAYAEALDDGRAEDAYRMLSDDARRGMSLEAFRKTLREHPHEARELARALRQPSSVATVSAVVTGPNGQELGLVFEKGRWRIDATAVDLYAQDTPRHAANSFVRALERRRYDVLLRMIPDARKDGIEEKTLRDAWDGPEKDAADSLAAAVKQALANSSPEVTGQTASLSHALGTMVLVRERGVWKVDSFD